MNDFKKKRSIQFLCNFYVTSKSIGQNFLINSGNWQILWDFSYNKGTF